MPQSIRILAVSTPVYKAGDVRARFTTAGGELVEVVLRAGLAKALGEGIHAALNPAPDVDPRAPKTNLRGSKALAPAKLEALRELHAACKNLSEASRATGISLSAVHRHFRAFDQETKAPVLKPGGKLL